ncbi:Putative endonuclease III [Ignavibacterium album JCM 16511]|uniref:Putative endonuclease III n=1 Tax=Ignavibacterium album (strain DSM 19864 / JCM 16511 / NBRC 101810 / Mat9-16) TaxID=945713 RepID=I0AK75_IGNAJ|nr:endonuclease III [Ignavibacterium album]AFH49382.1 Putative endonuclease III [Ignavibacterium album JCM 16511]
MKKQIERINQLLINHFGIPERQKKLPDPLDIIIGTILSQNTNDKNSYKAYLNLKSNINSWEDVLSLKTSQIERIIKVAGLGKQKAKAIKNLLKNLKKYHGKLSLTHLKKKSDDEVLDELILHKGIGVKTASCVLLFAFDRNVCPVDTHVHRILNRVGVVETSNPEKTFNEIKSHIPKGAAHSFHTNLLRLGREYCTPTNPKCYECPIENVCNYKEKNFTIKKLTKQNNFFLLDSIK